MKTYLPNKLINYLAKEFLISLLLVVSVFIALILLINFVEEITFFKDKQIENLVLTVMYLALLKIPNTLIEISIFIFLFSGILFFVKIQRNQEVSTILISGISKFFPIIIPAIIAFVFGILIILIATPLSSTFIKYYEQTKRLFSSNENVIFINNSGLWFIEGLSNGYNIIRADKIINNDFKNLNNVTIYNLDMNFNFLKRIDSKTAQIKNKNWNLENSKILYGNIDNNLSTNNNYNINFVSSIDIEDLKNFFSNASAVSFWEINESIKILNQRGYSADELKIKLHKYLSLPIYLFGVILLSTFFTIASKNNYNSIFYLFYGLLFGFFLYFLNDLSIAAGKANKIPLIISVWSPAIIVVMLSIINLLNLNEK